jgi:ribosomal protein L11 methyltransferase
MPDTRSPTAWVEASLRVSEELAESVADVMARFAPRGVTLIYDTIQPDPDGEGIPIGPVTVRAYLPMGPDVENRRAGLAEALWHLSRISPMPAPVFREVADRDCTREWKKTYRPIRIGKRLLILPSWMDRQAAEDDVVLRLDPGMAFGTGMHPTTQLCLEALEERIQPGMDVIDVGCGSGILSIAALRLGAARASGWDIDPEAVEVARENAVLNGVESRFDIRPGSLQQLLAEKKSAMLVAANILAGVLRRMLHASLASTVRPGGYLLLSGILRDQSDAVETAVRESGLHLVEKKTRGDWVALLAEKRGSESAAAA